MDDLYLKSGVDTTKAASLSKWLSSDHSQGLNSPIGGFAGLFKPNLQDYKDPHIVSCTDGIGTKLLLGLQENIIDGLGQDLVAMCLNDLYVMGARPWFFLDYFATGKLNEDQFKSILSSIKSALKPSNTVLLGGETAEMPGLYSNNHFDMAGFVVGCVDKPKIKGPHLVKDGDILIGLASNGFHSNGYSLIRKWLEESKIDGQQREELIDHLLAPTRIYDSLPEIFELPIGDYIHALSNITGGGINENLPRMLKPNQQAKIKGDSLHTPKWMSSFILDHCKDISEVYGVFNLGVGMIAAIDKEHHAEVISTLKEHDLEPFIIGHVQESSKQTLGEHDQVVYE